MSYPMKKLGNGIYSQGKKLIFDIPEIIEANNLDDTPQNRTIMANELRALAPHRHPECDITIVRSRS